MTCIVGIVENDKVYLAGDSAGSSGHTSDTKNIKKVFHNIFDTDFIFGYSGSFRLGQILQYNFIPPENKWGWDFQRYIATNFIDTLQDCLKDNEYNIKENGVNFLMGYQNNLIEIQSDFSFFINSENHSFDSVGCGEEFAKGALSILVKDFNKESEEKLIETLKAVENFDAYVKPPFHIVHT